MKKFAPIAAIALLGMMFTSCKKDWTCTCTEPGTTDTDKYPINNVNKKDAKAACDVWNALYSGGCSLD